MWRKTRKNSKKPSYKTLSDSGLFKRHTGRRISKVIAIMPDGNSGAPCGSCRELMTQLMPEDYRNIEIMMDYSAGKIKTLGELTPEWWI